MNDHRDLVVASTKQSPGIGPTPTVATPPSSKRNSGLFSFFKWFRSSSKESVDSTRDSPTSSLGSIIGGSTSSLNSTGTAASFNFIPPAAYTPKTNNKCINPGPETDTYKARLKQRDKVREKDKNITLRKKYNLFFSRDKSTERKRRKEKSQLEFPEENCKSLPLMTKTKMEDEDKGHRRTNSDSSKGRKAGAYLHVKGKRKAPAPPLKKEEGSLSLRRKKRLAPAPPIEKVITVLNTTTNSDLVYADVDENVIQNDCLKLDHGVLKPTKELPKLQKSPLLGSPLAKSEIPVSPKPWYKRQAKRESKYELVMPPALDNNNHKGFKLDKMEDKRKSNMMFLTNISELDREASEIIKNHHKLQRDDAEYEMPEFMKPKELTNSNPVENDVIIPSKRKSAKDLIAKFNAITNVTKVTVNSAIFSQKKDYFGKKKDNPDNNKENKEISTKKVNGFVGVPLTKCETSACILPPSTPKLERPERKSWHCPKCNLENDYWRIICHVCSTIKPYFDNFASDSPPTTKVTLDDSKKPTISGSSSSNTSSNNSINVTNGGNVSSNNKEVKTQSELPILARSRTQIHFTSNNNNSTTQKVSNMSEEAKREEKEKLKKMLIEMKNSLPKRKSNVILTNRKSTIEEALELEQEVKQNKANEEQKEKQANTIKEDKVNCNINLNSNKDDKLQAIDEKIVEKEKEITKQITVSDEPYQLLRPKDFEDIYSEKVAMNPNHLYANLPSGSSNNNDVFITVPQMLNELKHLSTGAADTLEINKLLRRLENAIAKGDLTAAAGYARELAQLKVNCSVIRQKPCFDEGVKSNKYTVEMYVEDRLSHRGPFPIEVFDDQTVLELKQQVQKEFEIPTEVQRWILGKELASNDKAKLKDHNVTKGSPLFLYLVAPSAIKCKTPIVKELEVKELNIEEKQIDKQKKEEDKIKKYNQQVQLGPSPSGKTNLVGSSSGIPIATSKIQTPTSGNPKVTPGLIRSEKSAFAVVNSNSGINDKLISSSQNNSIIGNSPKIVGEHLKVHVMIKPKTNAETQIGEIAKSSKPTISILPTTDSNCSSSSSKILPPTNSSSTSSTQLSTAIKTSVVVQTAPSTSLIQVTKTPPKAEQEDFSEYDKTLKPKPTKESQIKNSSNPISKEAHWICHMCTLVNPPTINICTVCTTVRLKPSEAEKLPKEQTNKLHYYELMHLDNSDLVPNSDTFECLICLTEVAPKEGVTLRDCLHQFCKPCLAHTIEFCDEAEVKCPYRDPQYSCDIPLQAREIKALVSKQVHDQFLAKSVAQAENRMAKTFHCKTPDCTGWCVFEDNVNEFKCPICKKTNCLTCQAIHLGVNCRQYQERMQEKSETDDDARQTREMLDEMVEKGEALTCPACQVILMKKWGCDWVRCSMCKTEICWVTRGLRWGPGGKGDTSGGCKCGVNGVKCHAKCNYCH